MHKARVERLTKDLENCTTDDFMGVAACLLEKNADYARKLVASLSDAVDVVGSTGTITYKNVMGMLHGKEGVWLLASGDKKIQVIKAVRMYTDLGLKEAKVLVDSVPSKLPPANISAEGDATGTSRGGSNCGAPKRLKDVLPVWKTG